MRNCRLLSTACGARAAPRSARAHDRRAAHRGPDGNGIYVDGDVGLAHARLSIIDLAGGQQPMCNEDGTVWITFNGEIFNYVELRAELIARGHRFRTTSDTEVIVHALRGARARLRSCAQRRLRLRHLGRAPAAPGAGARPRRRAPALLRGARRRVAFASEVKALLAGAGHQRRSSTRSRSTRCSRSGRRWRRARRSRTSPSCRRRTCSWPTAQGITSRPYWRFDYPDAADDRPRVAGRGSAPRRGGARAAARRRRASACAPTCRSAPI